MTRFEEIIDAGEYDHYGVRAHRAEVAVGKGLGVSRVWVDGECTDEELDGISTIRIRSAAEVAPAIDRLRKEYCWDKVNRETIVLVGGYSASHGEDRDEIIIRDNICLAVL